jgi:hypothetical protein
MSYQARTVRATTATGFNIAVAGALLGVLLSAAPGQAAEIPWRSGAFDVPTRTPAEIATVLEAFAARDGAARHVVVQFDGPVDDDMRAMLAAEGLELLAYVGANSYFAAVTPGRVDAGALSATRALLGVVAIQPAWKLHPLLSTGRAPAVGDRHGRQRPDRRRLRGVPCRRVPRNGDRACGGTGRHGA